MKPGGGAPELDTSAPTPGGNADGYQNKECAKAIRKTMKQRGDKRDLEGRLTRRGWLARPRS